MGDAPPLRFGKFSGARYSGLTRDNTYIILYIDERFVANKLYLSPKDSDDGLDTGPEITSWKLEIIIQEFITLRLGFTY
jgi:hypothetical protein